MAATERLARLMRRDVMESPVDVSRDRSHVRWFTASNTASSATIYVGTPRASAADVLFTDVANRM
jgi:hypothetical protein